MKRIIYPACFVLVLFLFGCGSTQKITQPKYNPQFNYTPDAREQITGQSLSVAIIDPVFKDGKFNNLVEPYTSFVGNMADDFEEALNARGFKIKGPYKNRDEMVYTDKLNTDFALEIEVEVLAESGDFGPRDLPFKDALLYSDGYRLAGTFYHKGRIILTATDPIDGEKFWKKTVDLDRKSVTCDGELIFTGPVGQLNDAVMLTDMGIYNPVAKVLESYYSEAMRSLERQIDPREMEQVSKEIKAKRARVGQ